MIKILSFLGVIFACLLVFLHFGLADVGGEGRHLKNSLIYGLENSERAEISIHSDRDDFLGEIMDFEKTEYERLELSQEQRSLIASHLKVASSRTKNFAGFAGKKCGFIPHHTFIFYSSVDSSRMVSICFLCDAAHDLNRKRWTEWEGVESIKEAFLQMGLKVERDWTALASGSEVYDD